MKLSPRTLLRSILHKLPTHTQTKIQRLRQLPRQIEAHTRRQLPHWLGGHFQPHQLIARTLTPSDLHAYQSLLQHPNPQNDPQPLRQRLQSTDEFAIGLFWKDQLLASQWCIQQWKHLDISGHWLASTFVSPAFRRRGLTKILHNATLHEARQRHIHTLHSLISTDNTPAQRAIDTAGFLPLAHTPWLETIEQHLQHLHNKPKRWTIYQTHLHP